MARRIARSAAGYARPPLAGLGAAVQLQRGHVAAVLALTVVTAGVLLFLFAGRLALIGWALVKAFPLLWP